LPALKHGGYDWKTQVCIGEKPSGGKHQVDLIATKEGFLILVSCKWQQVSGTAEQKIPFEVICLIRAMESKLYAKAYIVLGGGGWTLRGFYVKGGLRPYISGSQNVQIVALEQFIALANKGIL
jgi:hypothetical protein